MMKTLDWYLGRSIIQTTGFALMVLVGISTLIKFIEQLKSVGRGSYDIATELIASVMKTAMFMAICMMALGEWGAPEAQLKAKEIRNHAINGGDVFNAKQGVWAKDGSNFINIEDVDQQGVLRGVHMYHFDKSLQLTQITKAKEAVNRKDGWLLRGVNKVKITPEQKS